jgi:hypothetical protein
MLNALTRCFLVALAVVQPATAQEIEIGTGLICDTEAQVIEASAGRVAN